METREFNIEKLITEVQLRPAIWDMRDDNYSNRIKKKQAWEEVTTEFLSAAASVEEKKIIGPMLQKKWKNVRDRYSKHLSESKGKSGQGRKGKTPYMCAQQLSFLSDVVQRRATESSLDATHELAATDDETAATPQEGTDEDASIEPPDQPNTTKRESRKRQQQQHYGEERIKKKKNDSVETVLCEALQTHTDIQKGKLMKEKESVDDDKHFLLSLLPFFKKIPIDNKLLVRMELMALLNRHICPPPHQHHATTFSEPPSHFQPHVEPPSWYTHSLPPQNSLPQQHQPTSTPHLQNQPGPSGLQRVAPPESQFSPYSLDGSEHMSL
ncbi:uncharacterized protein LOC126744879 [Anthonomus grandis grandis]|uniref:uncharacterized protein LOC126738562 n=1 Tax=Anthonomus grandis grandis TaxID=2921223 RepID=UPI002166004B|nr:uncharacterized protein LOC126738562 [Anthonomus grandis grandis]XP_050308408.1 uncharacterized protein LOC126744879 [Anthonomus grandis grandis]